MTYNNNKTTKGPDFVAYNVRNNPEGKDHWDRVGVGFAHRDGEGVDIRLNAIPTDGHVTLRKRAQDFQKTQGEKIVERRLQRSNEPNIE